MTILRPDVGGPFISIYIATKLKFYRSLARMAKARNISALADRVSWSSLHIRATHPSEAHSNSILNAKTYVAETFRENSP